jgi:hypothetical protein
MASTAPFILETRGYSANTPSSGTQFRTWSKTFFVDHLKWRDSSPVLTQQIKLQRDQSDRPSFIDLADDVFEHVLQYLRTGILPVFYDQSKGHDYALYYKVLHAARHLQIERLGKWIEQKKYLEAVKVHLTVERLTRSPFSSSDTFYGPAKVLSRDTGFTERWGHITVGVPAHHDFDLEYQYRETVPHWSITRKEVIFDYDLCLNAFLQKQEFVPSDGKETSKKELVPRDSEETVRNQ